MSEVVNIIMAILKVVSKLNLDIETTAEGKLKICITVDPKDITKDAGM